VADAPVDTNPANPANPATSGRPAGRQYRYLDAQAVARLGKINLVARGVVEGFVTGLHKSPYHGFSVEFSEHRAYAAGDEIRHIDWKSLARTDRLVVKLFENETNVRAYILIDKSASMGYGSGPLTKLEYACYLAGCLAYLMVRQQDSVGLVSFDEQVGRFIPPRSTASHISVLLDELEAIRAEKKTGIARTFHDLAENMKRRSLVIILSDLLDDEREVLKALHHFRHRKHEVILFHILDHAEREFPFDRLADFVDMETGERLQVDPKYARDAYLEEMAAFVKRLKQDCARSLVEYVPVDTATPFDLMLTKYLALRGKTR
jgi:uncharacterized protein (DUF58 family)